MKVTNNFWITGDILFPLPDGPVSEVFRLANNAKDASVFDKPTAEAIASLVARRIQAVRDSQGKPLDVKFKPEPSENPKGLWVVHGTQEVEIESA